MKRRSLVASYLLTALALIAPTACHPSSNESDTTAITNRPQSYDRFIAILKLKTPALLETAAHVNGISIIDEAQKALLLAEQDALIAELTALSPDIKVLYRYKLVLNAVAIVGPKALEEKFRALGAVAYVEKEGAFERMAPVVTSEVNLADVSIAEHNSVSFIGAARVHNEVTVAGVDGLVAVAGKGVRVGVIDTGIDYTHAMFGGAGSEEAYTANNPDTVEDASFPTAKVVGGIDLVGTAYNSGSSNFEQHVPKPDADPLDEAGHGSHVAGTIAGLGDGIETYSGVAPDADLYAIKVFGADGSTSDSVIVAALEYAADPNGDLDVSDRLDVVNLSLGSGFGTPHILYSEAVKNLVKGDTVFVASAGNAGDSQYIVGAPSTSDDAISVAASIDDMSHNWQFSAVAFKTVSQPELLAEAFEAGFAKPIADAGAVSGKLVFLGLAAAELTADEKAAVAGNVALIDRGQVPFAEKGQRAFDAGAIGVIVVNNVDGSAFAMGGDGSIDIPAIMISKALGDILKADMLLGDASVNFVTTAKIEKPELIDTLTDFSSRGPRSIDGAIKPEIAAPGSQIISAKMGSGNKGVKFSGTSMAAPHMAGVMALMRQAHPLTTAQALKSLVVTTSAAITDASGTVYPVAYAGGGRVQAFEAVTATLAAFPATLSLGEVLVETSKVIRKELSLSNLGTAPLTLTLTPETDVGLVITAPASVTLAAGETKTFDLKVKITAPAAADASLELDGFLKITGDSVAHKIPVLAVINRTTRVKATALKVLATSPADAAGAEAELTLKNEGHAVGEALPFNLLAKDERKEAARANVFRNGICDLESVGWRVIKKTVDGVDVELLQVALKLYNPVTSWHVCEASILVDKDGDGVADQELLGTYLQTLTNNAANVGLFASALTDATAMRTIRHDYEIAGPTAADPVYTPAILDMQDYLAYGHSTLAVVTADLSLLAKTATGDLRLKVAMLTDSTSPESDDYLGATDRWLTLTPSAEGQAFVNLPEIISLNAGETKTVELTKGGANGNMVVYMPFNQSTTSSVQRDEQAKVIKPKFAF